jgi:arylsulfatase A-like enzyme
MEPSFRPTIAITLGDPAGIGPEVIVKALSDSVLRHKARYAYRPWLTVLLAALLSFADTSRGADSRPNILFAIADDASHFGAYGHRFVRTPHIDRVAAEGVRFDFAFTPLPKCSPSRASILTGRYPWQNEEACDHYGVFPAKFKVYPDLLEAAGYHVGFTGKGWGPGDFARGGFTRNPAGTAYNQAKLKPPTNGISNIDYAANFKAFLGKRANRGQPFCFWYGGHEPHRPYEFGSGVAKGGKKLDDAVVPPYLPDTSEVRNDLLDYALEIEWFDAQLGRMIKLLENAGELDNTLIVVTSDNGMPFPRVKGHIFEDACHLPLVMRWPGCGVKGGRVIEDFVSFVDFAPTFLEAAGLEPLAEISGRSMMPLLRSPAAGVIDRTRDHVVLGRERTDVGRPGNVGYPVRAIRTRDFLYSHNFAPDRWPCGDPETGFQDTDDGPSKTAVLKLKEEGEDKFFNLAMAKRPAEELYDLRKDPHAIENVADRAELAEIKAQLWQQLQRELTAQEDPRILGKGDVFDRYEYVGNKNKSWEAQMGKKKE